MLLLNSIKFLVVFLLGHYVQMQLFRIYQLNLYFRGHSICCFFVNKIILTSTFVLSKPNKPAAPPIYLSCYVLILSFILSRSNKSLERKFISQKKGIIKYQSYFFVTSNFAKLSSF